MKIIEGLKKIKYLEKKFDDIKKLISQYCADLDCEKPVYPDQRAQIDSWIQGSSDILKEISNLDYRLQKTNNSTMVSIELEGKEVQKSISEWIFRRRKLAPMELSLYQCLTDKNLQTCQMKTTTGELYAVHVRRYFDPKIKDSKIAHLSSEPFDIDSQLEKVIAVTDLVD